MFSFVFAIRHEGENVFEYQFHSCFVCCALSFTNILMFVLFRCECINYGDSCRSEDSQPFNDSQRLLSTISKVGKNNESTSNNRVLGFWSESTKTEGKKEPCLIWSMMLSQETVAKRRIQQERSSALFLWHSKRVQVTNKPGSCNSQGAYPCLAMPSLNLLSHVLLQI